MMELIRVNKLTKHFPITRGITFQRQVGAIQAVDSVSFTIRDGETLGLVGESGCGKSTLGFLIVRLLQPTAGKVFFLETDLTATHGKELRSLRQQMQIVFQDPYTSLNPRIKVGKIISEPLEIHRIGNGKERFARVQELLQLVGLSPQFVSRFPS